MCSSPRMQSKCVWLAGTRRTRRQGGGRGAALLCRRAIWPTRNQIDWPAGRGAVLSCGRPLGLAALSTGAPLELATLSSGGPPATVAHRRPRPLGKRPVLGTGRGRATGRAQCKLWLAGRFVRAGPLSELASGPALRAARSLGPAGRSPPMMNGRPGGRASSGRGATSCASGRSFYLESWRLWTGRAG